MSRGRAVLAGAVAAAVVVAAVLLAMRGGADGGPAASVPAVVGLDEDVAEDAVVKSGYSTQIVRRRDARSAGTVVAQRPPAGRRLAAGTVVVLVVSSGVSGSNAGTTTETTAQEPVTVARVTAMHHILAGARLEEQGLVVDSVAVADTTECGRVLRQVPAAGTQLQPGGHVMLTVSRGPEPRPVAQVPGLSGAESAARAAAREFGFTIRTVDVRASSPQDVGVVLRQSPSPLSEARELTQITLYIGR